MKDRYQVFTCRRKFDVSSSFQVTSTLQPELLWNQSWKVLHALGASHWNLKAHEDQWESSGLLRQLFDHVTTGPHPQQDVSCVLLINAISLLYTGNVNRDPTGGQD